MVIAVVCALIVNDDGRVLAARRSSSMDLPGKWEFPGGKVDPHEAVQEAIVREIREELNVTVCITRSLSPHTFHYPAKTIRLIPFVCCIQAGTIALSEHEAWNWFNHEELITLDWAEADLPVLEEYLQSTP